MKERYVGTCPFQITANQYLIYQGYKIHSTSAFSYRKKFARYIDEDKTFGKIRSCGGFDTVVFTEERLIGVEVKPEFSLTEFERALGEVIKHLISKFWSIRIEEGMIVMPFNNLGTPKVMMSKKRLKEEMGYTLAKCGYPISLNLLPVPCKIYDGN